MQKCHRKSNCEEDCGLAGGDQGDGKRDRLGGDGDGGDRLGGDGDRLGGDGDGATLWRTSTIRERGLGSTIFLHGNLNLVFFPYDYFEFRVSNDQKQKNIRKNTRIIRY